MDQFVATHTVPQWEGPQNGVLTMGYYTRADLEFWYSLADAFTIGDGYHCSVMGPTHPNRLHAWSGTLDPEGHEGGPVIITNSESSAIGSATWRSMPEELEAKGISWKVYNPPGSAYQPSSPLSIAISDNILLYFKRHVENPSSPLYKKSFSPIFPATSSRDVANDTLPQVSWIIPPLGFDEHPPSPPAAGMWFTHQVIKHAHLQPQDVVEDRAVHHVRRERRILRPCQAARCTAGNPGRVPDRRSPALSGLRRRRAPRPRIPGAAAGRVPLQPGRVRVLGHLRPHVAVAVPRDPLRRHGAQHHRLAPQRDRRPDLDAACRIRRHRRVPDSAGHAGTKRSPGSRASASRSSSSSTTCTNPAPYPVPADQTMPTQEPGAAVPVPA